MVGYSACDAQACDAALVAADVRAIDDAPVANPDTITTLEDTPIVLTDAMVGGNDVEVDGDSTVITWATHPDLDPGTLTFTPQKDSTDTVVLTYTLCDVGGAKCDTATLTIAITPQADDPIALGEAVTLAEDGLLTAANVDIVSNDVDPDGETLTIVWGVPAPLGSSSTSDAIGIAYQPTKDFVGAVVIPYSACAGNALQLRRCADYHI